MAKKKTEEEKFLIGRRKLETQIKILDNMVNEFLKVEGLSDDDLSNFTSFVLKLRKQIFQKYKDFLHPDEKLMEIFLREVLNKGILMKGISMQTKGVLEQLKNTKK